MVRRSSGREWLYREGQMTPLEMTIVNLFDLQKIKDTFYRNNLDVIIWFSTDNYVIKFPNDEVRIIDRRVEVLFSCLVCFTQHDPDFIDHYRARFGEANTGLLMTLLAKVKATAPETLTVIKPYLKGI